MVQLFVLPHFQTKNPFTLEINPVCVSVTKDAVPKKVKKQCMGLADLWVKHLESDAFTTS